jgi:hypothetical protein
MASSIVNGVYHDTTPITTFGDICEYNDPIGVGGVNGQVWTNLSNGNRFIWNASIAAWVKIAGS